MFTRHVACIISFLTLLLFINGCTEVAQNEVTLSVIGVNADISANYRKNAGHWVALSATGLSINVVDQDLENVDYLEVYATGEPTTTSGNLLKIEIFRDGKVVKSDSILSSGTTMTLSLDYTFGEEPAAE